ncbi:MAG: polysaccharide pyruvyl transferase family protein [Elusimicrobiales bacterium]|nr:polysaccharide pyruvyl transferase family protein [Elusimicrobiales bacterium]
MKKILFWSIIPPLNAHSTAEILTDNLIGSNSGNVMFQTSAARATMVDEESEFVSAFSWIRGDLDAFARRANEECSCFMIPLANAFRGNYISHLEVLTQLLKKLTIPCAVTGVGIQASGFEELDAGYAFDRQVRAFVSAALERSAMVGVRGAMTARYLKRLGFSEERHFTIIGCPSMYLRGSDLPKPKPLRLSRESRVCVNSKIAASQAVHSLIARGCREMPDYWYIPQTVEELRMMYAGVPIPTLGRRVPDYLPMNPRSPVLRRNRAVGFLNVPTWLDFMKDKDFSYGCNIHGNVAAVHAGVPALILARDLRVAEIAEYHELCVVDPERVGQTASVRELAERADFARVTAHHARRFEHFVDFLNVNGIEHIYAHGGSVQDAPFDRRLARVNLAPPVTARSSMTLAQRREALPVYRATVKHYWNKVKKKYGNRGR